MNSDQMKGKWKQIKGSVKERWGKLTDDDLNVIDGQTEQLIGTIQERYGIAREAAQKQVDEWNAAVAHESEVDQKRYEERRKAG
ncbi:MAG: CsbD family protein [Terriglobales bacterium]